MGSLTTDGGESAERTEGGYFKGMLLALVILAYFTGFIVRYSFLSRLGLSISATTLPAYYVCVYSYDVLLSQPWSWMTIVAIAVGSCTVIYLATRKRWDIKFTNVERFVNACVYPALLLTFVSAFPILAHAAQITADGEILDLYKPRHELGTRLVVVKQFLDDYCGATGTRRFMDAAPTQQRRARFRANPLHDRCRDPDAGAMLEAAEEGRLILVAETSQDLIFFERPANAAQTVFATTQVYRVKRGDAALASTRIGP